ncbi:uncharacterized protein BDR25DRAFT_355322 [Lindgomyces ingoldianus]|uniref:Uncharacterized protein n=1 Tax=Lindgomyces ingoldianus TaxID=673940 RepID=A0ACB6QVE5_9PLEO|nr:uncharacterized protein BDR25DRAFT_355322 [Lindgomyces ingoldianus]KAF2470831.1 hypothetical protein BDR25DRAFT_355322 [Lindgomyces ingoldianus]
MGLAPLRLLAGACPCQGSLPIPSELAEIMRSIVYDLIGRCSPRTVSHPSRGLPQSALPVVGHITRFLIGPPSLYQLRP